MRSIVAFGIVSLSCVHSANGQGRPVDWASYGGDAQRTGWAKSDSRITRDNVKDFQLVLKRKLETLGKGAEVLTPPVVLGNLISYRGFKELAFVAGSNNRIWSIDVDLDRMFWQKQLPGPAAAKSSCAAGPTAMPSLTPPANFGAAARAPRPARAPQPVNAPVAFGAPRPLFVITSDGNMHRVNTSDGSDQLPPIPFLPAGSKASTVTLANGVLYTTTSAACGGSPDAVWALDLNEKDPKPVQFPLTGGGAVGPGGFAIGTDGTVYVQTAAGTLLALSEGELKQQQSFSAPEMASKKTAAGLNAVTPVVFSYKDRDLVVSVGGDGRLYLLDSKSLGGEDHKTAMSRTEPVSVSGGVWGGLSSWQDTDNVRWVLAPVWGVVNPALQISSNNGDAGSGAIVAFKVQDKAGKATLVPVWISGNMTSPQPPVITTGTVFALASGDKSVHATMYALDALTGKQIYTTGDKVSTAANLTGMTLANGRLFFTTTDNTLYGFGVFLER